MEANLGSFINTTHETGNVRISISLSLSLSDMINKFRTLIKRPSQVGRKYRRIWQISRWKKKKKKPKREKQKKQKAEAYNW